MRHKGLVSLCYVPAFVFSLLFSNVNKRTKGCRLLDVSLIYLSLFCIFRGSRCVAALQTYLLSSCFVLSAPLFSYAFSENPVTKVLKE